jgi:hypothetical protein
LSRSSTPKPPGWLNRRIPGGGFGLLAPAQGLARLLRVGDEYTSRLLDPLMVTVPSRRFTLSVPDRSGFAERHRHSICCGLSGLLGNRGAREQDA